MQRITITIEEKQLSSLDDYITKYGYSSRSEAIRDILRDVEARELSTKSPSPSCYAVLSCVYEHGTRDLSRRLNEVQHHHHDLSVAALHVHISNQECLEVGVLKGPLEELHALANKILTQRGVRMGNIHIIPPVTFDK